MVMVGVGRVGGGDAGCRILWRGMCVCVCEGVGVGGGGQGYCLIQVSVWLVKSSAGVTHALSGHFPSTTNDKQNAVT